MKAEARPLPPKELCIKRMKQVQKRLRSEEFSEKLPHNLEVASILKLLHGFLAMEIARLEVGLAAYQKARHLQVEAIERFLGMPL